MQASLNLELKYKSPKHNKVLEMVRSRYQMSYDDMQKRWPAWREIRKEAESFMSKVDIDRKKKSREDNDLEIKIPFSWAMQQTAMMYLTSVFLARNPVFQYNGRHGEGQNQVMAMESLIDYQVSVGEMMPQMFSWINDALEYGLGVVGEYWCDETVRIRRLVEKPVTVMGIPVIGKTKKVTEIGEIAGYQGNRLFCVRPFDFFPDTRVPIRDFQRGEFCATLTELGYHEILDRAQDYEYFNIEEVGKLVAQNGERDSYTRERGITREDADIPTHTNRGNAAEKIRDFVEILEMYVKVIPNDWGLGNSTLPEMWVFTVANDRLLIGCRPFGMFHGRFPFHTLEYEVNGHNVHARSMTEIIKPMNDVMTWMFNSHIYNVRKTINNELVVDPSRLNMADFKRPGPGRLIRLSATAYGTDPRAAIHQLNMNDVTRGHLNDMNQVKALMQMVIGVNDSLMGALSGSGRKTATEVRTSSTFGVNRLKTVAEYFSATGFTSLSRNLVASTQQLYDQERMFKIAGTDLEMNGAININPEAISGFFDFVPVDGTLPMDRMLQSNMFKELLFGVGKMGPQFASQYNVGKIFEHILMLNGIKNINSFKVSVMPPGIGMGGAAPSATGGAMGANPAETMPTPGSPQMVSAQ